MQHLFILVLCLSITIGSPAISVGQPVVFSQPFASPLLLNPAFAGTKPTMRMAFGYRTHNFPNLNAFQTKHFSLDGYNSRLSGGLGIMFMRESLANIVHTNRISGSYSLHLRLTEKLFMNLGIDAGVINMGINRNNLIFSDQIHLITGEVFPVNESDFASDIWSPNFSTGLLIFGDRLYGGIALHYLNRPNLSLVGTDRRIPIRYTAKIGGNFPVGEQIVTSKLHENFFVSPNIIFQFIGVNTKLSYGLYFGLPVVYAGIWLRQDFTLPETLILMMGLRLGNFQFSYSYDHSFSGFSGIHHGAHEIGLSFSIANGNKNTRANIINSPDF